MTDKFSTSSVKVSILVVAAILGLAGLSYGVWHTGRVMNIASAYYAKILCSSLFVAGRGQNEAVAEDVLADMTVGLRHWHREVDYEEKLVNITVLGMAEREALYRPGLGCTLLTETTAEQLRTQASGYSSPPPSGRPSLPWPEGDQVDVTGPIKGGNRELLDAAVEDAFKEPRPERFRRRTRSVVVVHKGRIVAEKHAEGTKPGTPQIGWSMGKSVLHALIGTLVADERLKLEQNGLFEEWQGQDDRRAAITVDHLLRMVSGLDFDEPHARMLSDVRKMLFAVPDSAAYAVQKPLASPPGATWFYSSGSTTLLARLMRDAVGGSLADYFSYPRRVLFEPLGMNTAVMEPDPAGTFLAPAFVYASARDWARFGLFYLKDGVWNGKRILPEGWVSHARQAAPHSDGQYGAHFWLRIPDFLRPTYPSRYDLPEDAFYMLGHDGQMVAIIPSKDLVVVRLGLSRRRNAWDHEQFLSNILKSFH